MVSQEERGVTFVEEEVAESELQYYDWIAEAAVFRPVLVRGGIVCDEVGYGKTVITLALIDTRKDRVSEEIEAIEKEENERAKEGMEKGTKSQRRKLPVRATLVLVPSHLPEQWASECKKFLGDTVRVLVLNSEASLFSLSVAKVKKHDIIIASLDLFISSGAHWGVLAKYAGDPDVFSEMEGGRFFDDTYSKVLSILWDKYCSEPERKGVPLELFLFSRVVVDEFSYYLRKEETLYQGRIRRDARERWSARSFMCDGVSAVYRWALSGTPPLGNFDQVNDVVKILGTSFSPSQFFFSLSLSLSLISFSSFPRSLLMDICRRPLRDR
jgi:hypothetical protein